MEQRDLVGPSGAGTPDGAIDPDALAGLRDLQEAGEPDFLRELIDTFLTDASPRLASLRAAVVQGDADTAEREAHALKGSCANFGARPMEELCRQLQASGRSRDLAGAGDRLDRLDTEYGRVRAALTAALSKD